jgi:lipopolysaccharide/colanic/teichoic acid biosynthesis glycosyltransferase
VLKRLFDIVFSIIGLIILSPLFLIVGFLIKLEDGGPIFYRGIRIGKDGKPFRIFKFRTMIPDAEKRGIYSTADDDPRITRIGRVLRKYKIDELPQLINVLKGEMSFVGPRPEVPYYVEKFTEEERKILSVRPGITDWASLWDVDEGAILAGSPDPDKAYEELIRPTKIRLQLKYVREHSFFTDIKIIILTLLSIILRRQIWKPEQEDIQKSSC